MFGDVQTHECVVRSRLNVVIRDGREIRLEPQAMRVLMLLIERHGDVVSREEVLSLVWHERFVGDEVLTNAVSQIRRALADVPRKPRFIQTIAKGGYRWIAPTRVLPDERTSPRPALLTMAVGLVAAAIVAGIIGSGGSSTSVDVPAISGLVTVGEFESLSGDDDLEWLRTGIAELMVTGLSRTSRLRVVGPSHMAMAGAVDESRAELAIGGSFARIDGQFRVDAYAKDTTTGELVAAESVSSTTPSELFELVDDLAARLSVRLAMFHDPEPHLRRALREITTDSIEAYQLYVEAMGRYYHNLDHLGALELYEKAVELDPSFAMAYARMSILYMNVGDQMEAVLAGRRALEHIDRLPSRERHYVTGNFYVIHEESYGRALDAYGDALELDPDHLAARHNRGYIYFRLERYREAAAELEPLVAAGVGFPGSYRLLMLSHAALGEFETGRQVADAYLSRYPEKWVGYRNLGQHLMRWGRLEEASEALYRADALRPGPPDAVEWWQLKLLLEQPLLTTRAEGGATRSPAPGLGRAMQRLYAGRPREAIAELEKMISGPDAPGDWAPVVLNLSAAVKLQIGDAKASLDTATRARDVGRGNASEWQALTLASMASATLGDWEGARRLESELERKTAGLPTQKERRRLYYLRGELANTAGAPKEAVEALREAESLLAPRGFPITMQIPQHVPIRYARAEAHRAAGESREAMRWYRSVAESTTERLVWPIPFVRSLYRLGRLNENAGDHEQAIAYYRRYLSYWRDGELDRADVEMAERKVASYDARTASNRDQNQENLSVGLVPGGSGLPE